MRIKFDNNTFASKNFGKTPWRQSQSFEIPGDKKGSIGTTQLYQLQSPPDSPGDFAEIKCYCKVFIRTPDARDKLSLEEKGGEILKVVCFKICCTKHEMTRISLSGRVSLSRISGSTLNEVRSLGEVVDLLQLKPTTPDGSHLCGHGNLHVQINSEFQFFNESTNYILLFSSNLKFNF